MESKQNSRNMLGRGKAVEDGTSSKSLKLSIFQDCFGEIDFLNQYSEHQPAQTSSILEQNATFRLKQNYPQKFIENCHRTVRIILISELWKLVYFDIKALDELNQILGEYVDIKVNRDSDDDFKTKNKGDYYHTLSFSRVKIGKKCFEKKILTNPCFRSYFLQIFGQDLSKSQKIRKNQKSPVSFEEKRKVVSSIIKITQKRFIKSLNQNKITEESSHNSQESLLVAMEKQIQMFPLIPIPIYKNRLNIKKMHRKNSQNEL